MGASSEMLKAGREMDALVADRVMGYKLVSENATVRPASMSYIKPSEALPYSTDIAAAWTVVEKLTPSDCGFTGEHFRVRYRERDVTGRDGEKMWEACFGHDNPMWAAVGDTAPLAICRAALAVARHRDRLASIGSTTGEHSSDGD